MFSVKQDLGGVVFFISGGRDGILWRTRPRLTSVHVSEHISQNVQKGLKKDCFFLSI